MLGIGDNFGMTLGKWSGKLPTMSSKSVRSLHGSGIHVYLNPTGFDKSFKHPCRPVLEGHLSFRFGFIPIVKGWGGADTSDKDINDILSGKVVAVVGLGPIQSQIKTAYTRYSHFPITTGEGFEKIGVSIRKKFLVAIRIHHIHSGTPVLFNTFRPISVNRYFCLLLRGLSGIVISIKPAFSAGTR
jgi:hypothetical protein